MKSYMFSNHLLTVTKSVQATNKYCLVLQNAGQAGARPLSTAVSDSLSSLDQQSHTLEG
jgi:hypothetical protein